MSDPNSRSEPAAVPLLPSDRIEELPAAVTWAMLKVAPMRAVIYFGWRLATRWGQDQCPLKAAAMAFFGLLSIFPIILAAVSILATALAGNTAALQTFQEFVQQFFPGPTGENVSIAIENAITKIAGGSDAATLSVIALGSLIWSGRAFFQTLAEVLNGVWIGAKSRSFWQNQMVLWGTFLGAGLLWLLSTIATFLVTAAGFLLTYLPDSVSKAFPWLELLSRGSAFLFTVLMFWLIYRFLPNVQGTRRQRLIWGAALLAAFGWESAKIGFTKFMGNLDRYEMTYGSVAGVVVTMMWIYVSSLIILLGAEAAAAYEETTDDLPRLHDTLEQEKHKQDQLKKEKEE